MHEWSAVLKITAPYGALMSAAQGFITNKQTTGGAIVELNSEQE
jgi:hypothetical protein